MAVQYAAVQSSPKLRGRVAALSHAILWWFGTRLGPRTEGRRQFAHQTRTLLLPVQQLRLHHLALHHLVLHHLATGTMTDSTQHIQNIQHIHLHHDQHYDNTTHLPTTLHSSNSPDDHRDGGTGAE